MNGRLALRVLDALAVDGAVIGDLQERLNAAGRVRLWREVSSAIGAACVADIRRNPAGIVLIAAAAYVSRAAIMRLGAATEPTIDAAMTPILRSAVDLSRPALILVIATVNALFIAPCWLAIVWLFARCGRPRSILVFVALVCLLKLPGDARQIVHVLVEPGVARYRTTIFANIVVANIAFLAAVLAGSVTGIAKRATHD